MVSCSHLWLMFHPPISLWHYSSIENKRVNRGRCPFLCMFTCLWVSETLKKLLSESFRVEGKHNAMSRRHDIHVQCTALPAVCTQRKNPHSSVAGKRCFYYNTYNDTMDCLSLDISTQKTAYFGKLFIFLHINFILFYAGIICKYIFTIIAFLKLGKKMIVYFFNKCLCRVKSLS